MTDTRQNIVAWANYFAGKTSDFVYSEANDRMSALGVFPLKFPIHADCSAFVTLCYWLSGAADPCGGTAYTSNSFGREGYTGTLLGHDLHIAEFTKNAQGVTVDLVQPGDLVVYGGGEGQHVALIVSTNGPDILTVSHGGPTGQSPIYCWVNKPIHGNPKNYPTDGRQPQTFLRCVTAAVNPIHLPPTVA